MQTRFTNVVALLLLSVIGVIAGCNQQEPVSNDTLEQARYQAKKNGVYNARVYQTENIALTGWAIEGQSDSSITPTCPQGDGWVSVTMRNRENMGQTYTLKCSSVSGALGCLPDEVFNTKSYKSEDGTCQPTTKVPFPLPKLGG